METRLLSVVGGEAGRNPIGVPQRWFLQKLLASPLAWIHVAACAGAPFTLALARPVSAFGLPSGSWGRDDAWLFLAAWTGAMLGAADLGSWAGALRLGGRSLRVGIEAQLVGQRIVVGQVACILGLRLVAPLELAPLELLGWIICDVKIVGVTLCIGAVCARAWEAALGAGFVLGFLPAVLAGSSSLADRIAALLGPPSHIRADSGLDGRVLASQALLAASCVAARWVGARSLRPTHDSPRSAP
jgi:hypothetical protein